MEETSVLYMSFRNGMGNICTITVDDPREDLQGAEVKTFMQKVIDLDIFVPKGYNIVSMVSAKIVNKDTVEYDLEV